MARTLQINRLVITRVSGGPNRAHFEYSVTDGDLRKNGMHDEANLDTSVSVDTIVSDFEASKGAEENIPNK